MDMWLKQKEASKHRKKYDDRVVTIQKALEDDINFNKLQQERAVKRKHYIDTIVEATYKRAFIQEGINPNALQGHISIQDEGSPSTPVIITIQYKSLRGIDYGDLSTCDFSQEDMLSVTGPNEEGYICKATDLVESRWMNNFYEENMNEFLKLTKKTTAKIEREIQKRIELATQYLEWDAQTSTLTQELITSSNQLIYTEDANDLVPVLTANFIGNNYLLLKKETNAIIKIKALLMKEPAHSVFSEYRKEILREIQQDSTYDEFKI